MVGKPKKNFNLEATVLQTLPPYTNSYILSGKKLILKTVRFKTPQYLSLTNTEHFEILQRNLSKTCVAIQDDHNEFPCALDHSFIYDGHEKKE